MKEKAIILKDSRTFGTVVRSFRKKQGITQIQLAAVANTGVRYIGDLENGKTTVQLDMALRVAYILGMQIEARGAGR
ncbi:MAG: helix-turn-helix domain-containing protein [Treponema sp.]|nr:helix-turn-helix domain-containing protein [Treponema sp.]